MGKAYTDRGQALPSNNSSIQQIYTRLQNNEIRTLLLAPGKKNDTIVCELEVNSSTKQHQYEALSYVWGDARVKRSIECNGVNIQVTESLYDALVCLRYGTGSSGGNGASSSSNTWSWRRMWVDQLCIDQGRADELMDQVRFMGRIYSDASRVVVWLGKRDSMLTGAWKLIRETMMGSSLVRSDFLGEESPSGSKSTFASPSASASSPSGSVSSRSFSLKSRSPGKKLSFSRSSSGGASGSGSGSRSSSSRSSLRSSMSRSTESLTSVDSFRTPIKKRSRKSEVTSTSPVLKKALAIFQHEWFTRKWTFQEIVMSKAAIVCCGDIEMAWSDLTAWYFHYAAKLRSTSLLYDSMGLFENIMTVRSELDKQFDGLSDGIKLADLLMLTRQRNSLKAEDTIYALLGLHAGFSKYLKDITEEEGWLPVPELFLAAFRYCLEVEKDISVLSAAGLYNGNKSYHLWASWLPDWRAQLPLRPLTLSACSSPRLQYKVSDKSELVHQILEDDGYSILHVKGFCIGTVATRADSWPNTYLVAGEEAQSILDFGIPTVHAQFISALILPKEVGRKSTRMAKSLSSSIARNETCEPMRTSASVQAGDWVCVLLGGPVLYIIRPIVETEIGNAGASQNIDNTQSTQHMESIKGRFVGECAVTSLMDSSLREKLSDSDMMEFRLV